MKVAKWGNSLAVRLPADLVQKLGLKEGDDLHLTLTNDNRIEIAKVASLRELREDLKRDDLLLPPDFKFDRDEANER